MRINALDTYYTQLNKLIKHSKDNQIIIDNCLGQRYIGTGVNGKEIIINGTPGNALGAYLKDCQITVYGNVQDAVGDTMDSGDIIVYGSGGDTVGYGMRGGNIYIKDHAGYRIGIHMKEYQDKKPVIVIGGSAGSFLGEYQAGGKIIVLGLDIDSGLPCGNYLGTGMHGNAQMYVRSDTEPSVNNFLNIEKVEDLGEIMPYLKQYCDYFDISLPLVLEKPFYKITPGEENPFDSLYTPY